MNYLTPKTRREVLDMLVGGMKRQEYRGYDSAGVAFDSLDGKNMLLVRRQGKVKTLEDAIIARKFRHHTISVSVFTCQKHMLLTL